ncbi:Pycsar system effector family protein [Haladaptatus sp. DFWS20]|uniref:Pycsar system effector family protein n=1 Tax=Haladaptatus sp. DFWS20 TaxID=3403467 RepID=UPI003EBADB18
MVDNDKTNNDGISRSEFSLMVHDHLNEYIKVADRKASLLLSAQIAFLGLFANLVNSSWNTAPDSFKLFSALTVVALVAAGVFAAKAVYPNTPETSQGLILWTSIVDGSANDYQNSIAEKSEIELRDELVDENYQLARVTKGKYKDIRYTIGATAVAIFFALISGIVLFAV